MEPQAPARYAKLKQSVLGLSSQEDDEEARVALDFIHRQDSPVGSEDESELEPPISPLVIKKKIDSPPSIVEKSSVVVEKGEKEKDEGYEGALRELEERYAKSKSQCPEMDAQLCALEQEAIKRSKKNQEPLSLPKT
jgi:hypothetical protein